MNHYQKITIKFSMPVTAKKLFDFIILPQNMLLYQGFFLIPGIKNVISSDLVRKNNTIDLITNTDGSSHQSKTTILKMDSQYALEISNIQMVGLKKYLANPILGFVEDWVFTEINQQVHVERTLIVRFKGGFLNTLFIKYFVRPQLYFSLVKHHKNVLQALSQL